VFKPKIDPRTLLYTDILPYYTTKAPSNALQREQEPRLRPYEKIEACELIFESATGVPLPEKENI
jgi:hypothetical protein